MGSGADEPEPTAADKANAQNALDTLKQHQQYVLPLELEEIRRTYDPGVRGAKNTMMDKSANFSAMLAEAQSRAAERGLAAKSGQSLGSTGSVVRRAAAGEQGMRTAAQSLADANTQANKLRLGEKFGLLESGQSISRQHSKGLGQVAMDATSTSLAQFQADQQVQQARAKALGDVVMTAGVLGYDSYKTGKDPYTNWEDLSPVGRMVRTHDISNNPQAPFYGDKGTIAAIGDAPRGGYGLWDAFRNKQWGE